MVVLSVYWLSSFLEQGRRDTEIIMKLNILHLCSRSGCFITARHLAEGRSILCLFCLHHGLAQYKYSSFNADQHWIIYPYTLVITAHGFCTVELLYDRREEISSVQYYPNWIVCLCQTRCRVGTKRLWLTLYKFPSHLVWSWKIWLLFLMGTCPSPKWPILCRVGR